MPLLDLTAKWYRLMYPCPQCERLPAIRVAPAVLAWVQTLEPETPLLSYQCQRVTCVDHRRRRTTFILAADAFQRAELVEAMGRAA